MTGTGSFPAATMIAEKPPVTFTTPASFQRFWLAYVFASRRCTPREVRKQSMLFPDRWRIRWAICISRSSDGFAWAAFVKLLSQMGFVQESMLCKTRPVLHMFCQPSDSFLLSPVTWTASLAVTLIVPPATVMFAFAWVDELTVPDRKSTRLNSSHANISYAVFCLKQ